MPIGAAIGAAAGSIGGAIIGGNAQKKAAQTASDTSLAVARENNALAKDIYGQNKATLTPSITRGNAAGERINALLGLSTPQQQASALAAFKTSPGYDWRVKEGEKAINSGYAARGIVQSGAAQKSLLNYGQNAASAEWGNYMAQLANQQGVGLSGASALAGVSQNYVNGVSANNNSAGSAAANAALVAGNAQGQMWQTAGSALGNIFGSAFH